MKPNKLKETEIGYIPEDWDMTTLNEISLKVTDGSHFSPKESNDSENIICTVKDMEYHKFSFEKAKKISNKDFDELFKNGCSPEKGDILISKDGANCLDLMFVYGQNKQIVLLSSIAIVRLKQNFNPFFYRYYLLSPQVQKLMRNGYISGSAIPRVVLKDFKKLPVPLINNTSEEEKIANILKSIDDKIQINQKMNQTLEEIGQAIFKHWFVHFEFPNDERKPYKSSGGEMIDSELGEIPKGWEVQEIGNIIETTGGGTPSTKKEEYWENGDIQWFSPRDITANRQMFISNSEKRINSLGLEKSSAKIFPQYSLMMTSRATVGELSINTIKASTNQGFITCIPNERLSTFYLYYWIKMNKEYIISLASGSTFKEINKSTFRSLKVVIPNENILKSYDSLLEPIFNQIQTLQSQNENLSQIRDSILPKLMSGKIRVI